MTRKPQMEGNRAGDDLGDLLAVPDAARSVPTGAIGGVSDAPFASRVHVTPRNERLVLSVLGGPVRPGHPDL